MQNWHEGRSDVASEPHKVNPKAPVKYVSGHEKHKALLCFFPCTVLETQAVLDELVSCRHNGVLSLA